MQKEQTEKKQTKTKKSENLTDAKTTKKVTKPFLFLFLFAVAFAGGFLYPRVTETPFFPVPKRPAPNYRNPF